MGGSRGRPKTPGREDAVAQMFARMHQGESIRSIAQALGIERRTLTEWANETPELARQYARAREAQADAHVDEALRVAANSTAETVQADRLYVDTLKWRASKFHPKRYGDKSAVDVTSGDEKVSFVLRVPPVDEDGATWARRVQAERARRTGAGL